MKSNTIAPAPGTTQLAATVAALPKTARAVPVIIPPGISVNGQVTPAEISLTQSGDRFYVIAASAQIFLQPMRAGNIGALNPFQTGQGQTVQNGFENLKCANYNLFPIAALVWIGFEDFINDQLVLATNSTPQVTYPTQPIPAGSSGDIQIPDLSGQKFNDVNGKAWYAISRVAIIISNISTGTVLTLSKFGSTATSANAVLAIPAGLPIAHNSSGNFTITVGGASVPAIVSEIYYAIAA